MERHIYLAYDGSINADWLSRYAIRMAAALEHRQLVVVHIHDGSAGDSPLETRFAAIAAECAAHGIELRRLIEPLGRGVAAGLLAAIPPGPDSFCLCGARIAPRGRGFLAGTVSEQLLRAGRFNVMAIRVVSPGLLGRPTNLLFPLAGHPRGFAAAMPFLRLLTPSLSRLHLFRVMEMNPFRFRYISAGAARKKLTEGLEYLKGVSREIRAEIAAGGWQLDRHAVLSDDWAKEILIEAGRVHASMILLGATERNLPSRLFYGNRLEQILRHTPCDAGIYRGP